MNKDFIYNAIAIRKLDKAFNSIEFAFHVFNDGTPSNEGIRNKIHSALIAVTEARAEIRTMAETEKQLTSNMQAKLKGQEIPRRPRQRIE